jgi:hypothetical protein
MHAQEPDFEEDEFIYDDLNLEEEERIYSIPNADDVVPSLEDEGMSAGDILAIDGSTNTKSAF